MHRFATVVALLLASSLSAQDHSSPISTTVLTLNPATGACPVSMYARQGVWDHTIKIRSGNEQYNVGFGQRIFLTLTDTHAAQILTASVRIHGYSGKNHMVQTGGATGDATKSVTVKFNRETDGSVFADLYIPGFTAVTYLQLEDVSYADGSIWKMSDSNICRVAPDPLMLIAAH